MNYIKSIALLVIMLIGSQSMGQVGSWTQKSDFNGASRSYAISFGIGAYGYLGGGTTSNGRTQDFWEYDPVNDTWTQKADISGQGRFGAVGFAIGNKGYSGLGTINGVGAGDFYEYDPVENDWNQTAPFPGTNSITASTFVIGDKGYVATGASTSVIGNETQEVWQFDPVNVSWTQKQDFPGEPRSRAMSFVVNEKGYLGCGYHYDGSSAVSYRDFWEYTPDTDSWVRKSDFAGSSRSNAVGFALGSHGFMGLGYNGSVTANDLWRYDIMTDDWTQVVYFEGQARLASSYFVVNNKAYVGTGYYVTGSNTISLDDMWEYEGGLLSSSKNHLEALVTVFPNPFVERLTIGLEKGVFINATVVDLRGRVILESSSKQIDLSSLNSGVYIIKIKTDIGLISKRVLKK